jgi:NAD(P)-dependent dehydrogenase (short-subunit alcohol dehydrogenase family)
MELAYKTVLVTGGTAGIGLACARLVAQEGASRLAPLDFHHRVNAARRRRLQRNLKHNQEGMTDVEEI